MRGLLIAGAGGHGRVVLEIATMQEEEWKIAFVDDRYPELSEVSGVPVIGKISETSRLRNVYPAIALAVGDLGLRMVWMNNFLQQGFELPVLVHPAAWISESASLGVGSQICAHAAVVTGARIGRGTIVNTAATVDHDCIVGDAVHVCPGVHLGGEVQVGERSWIGIGTSCIQGVSIGRGVIVGAGSVILKDIPDGRRIAGVPARPIDADE